MVNMDDYIEQAIEILAQLVHFDTTSHKTNLPLIAYIEEILKAASIPYSLIPNDEGDKASLFATIGPSGPLGIGLSGHTDVVPVEGQEWHTDPFKLTQKGEQLFGRGTTDMKGFLACMLAAIPAFKAAPLQQPIYLIFSYDEEIGCTGVRPLVNQLGVDLPMPSLVLVGEPSNCQVVEAHKSITSYVTRIIGHEAHSSLLHQGVSAIEIAAKLINHLTEAQQKLKSTQNDARFDPSYSTVHVGRLEGGTARNIVAKDCEFLWEVRALPDFDGSEISQTMMEYAEKDLLPGMKSISPDTDIVTEQITSVPGLASSSSAVSLGMKLANQNESFVVSYGTEAGLFEDQGAASVICGPGSIEQAHKPNEFIDRAELVKCLAILGRVADHQSS
ncbi:MAG: acetylornithine deacetylase [Rhodomicrobiaceae bacterium]|jgi:acetylornithine deacetylase